jgi:hypothetical protein
VDFDHVPCSPFTDLDPPSRITLNQ